MHPFLDCLEYEAVLALETLINEFKRLQMQPNEKLVIITKNAPKIKIEWNMDNFIIISMIFKTKSVKKLN